MKFALVLIAAAVVEMVFTSIIVYCIRSWTSWATTIKSRNKSLQRECSFYSLVDFLRLLQNTDRIPHWHLNVTDRHILITTSKTAYNAWTTTSYYKWINGLMFYPHHLLFKKKSLIFSDMICFYF